MKRDANELGNILENSLETPELQAHNSLKKVTKKPWNSTFHGFLWWTRRDSNPRPLGCEPNALPTELRARLCLVWINLTHLDCAICWSAWARVMLPLLSQLSYRPKSTVPKAEQKNKAIWNYRCGRKPNPLRSQLSYRPIFGCFVYFNFICLCSLLFWPGPCYVALALPAELRAQAFDFHARTIPSILTTRGIIP